MKSLVLLREEAVRLRRSEGLSLNELAARLQVARTTIYYWVKNVSSGAPTAEIQMQRSESQKANQRLAAVANQAKHAARRKENYDLMREKASEVLQDLEIRDFVVLYLAEGYRKDKNAVGLSNSNPNIIAFTHNCLKRLATNKHFYYSFQYHADQNPDELQLFWASYLGIDAQQIHPIPKTNSGHLKGRRFACEYGIFQIKLGDTRFRAELQALMDAVQEEWAAR
jgi:transposase-like protein